MTLLAAGVFIGVLTAVFCATPYFTELETLEPSQKDELEKLKNSVVSILPEDYMKQDIFLVKFLQATEFNVGKAEEMLKELVNWRTESKLENWDDPSYFADFEAKGEYPIFNDGVDREGRPIAEAFFGDWNVRAAALAGKIKNLTHYSLSRSIDRGSKRIREFQAEGKNVSQIVDVVNMEGFNLVNQACLTCMPLYLGFVGEYEKYWPNTVYKMILVNTPESFEIILNLIRPLMSPQSKEALTVFGSNKEEWKPYLDKLIDPTELSNWYDPKGKDRTAQ